MKTRIVMGATTFAMLFAGWAVGQRPQSPPITAPPQWVAVEPRGIVKGEALPEWWITFKDATLTTLIKRAVDGNLDLQQAVARLNEARSFRGVARSGLFPSVGAGVSASRSRQRLPGTRTTGVEFDNFEGHFDANWEIDVSGRIRSGLRAASADAVAAEEARRDVLVSLLGEVGRTYAELRGLQLRLAIAQKNIRTQQDTVEITQARAKAGLATDLDVERAIAQLESTRSVVPSLEADIQVEIHRLSVLIGQNPGALESELSSTAPLPIIPPQVPIGLPSELLERRPDVRQSEAEITAARARVKEAKAEYFPRFTLFGTAGRQASALHDITLGVGNFFTAGPSVSLPVFTGGRIRSNIRVQDARLQQATIGYRKAVLSALEETEDALVSYSNEQERRERLESAVRSNEEAVKLSNERYRAGLTDFLSVLDAQRELYANEDLLARSRTTQALDLIALYKALGGGWQPFSRP